MNYFIQKEDHSVSILKIQQCLNRLRSIYPQMPQTPEDGMYGDETEQTIKIFQSLTGLEVTGIINDLTWDKIICKTKTLKQPETIHNHPHPSLNYGDKGLDVYKAQEYLNQIQPEKPIEINGIFNAQTQIKVIRFQNMTGLNPDGRIDRNTWDKMIEVL